jgi:hypothetical protein
VLRRLGHSVWDAWLHPSYMEGQAVRYAPPVRLTPNDVSYELALMAVFRAMGDEMPENFRVVYLRRRPETDPAGSLASIQTGTRRHWGYHRRVSDELFVPEGFTVPDGLTAGDFRLAPLGPQHNESDYAAWTASVDHIRATPGFGGRRWPHEMSLDDNLRDLEEHARDFAGRRGFTYTVLSASASASAGTGDGDVIGCVYIYPPSGQVPGGPGARHADVRSWVRADHAALDPALYDVVLAWLERDWPFDSIDYAART